MGTSSTASNQYQNLLSTDTLEQVQNNLQLAPLGMKKGIPAKQGHKAVTFYQPTTVTYQNVIEVSEGQVINVYNDVENSTITATLAQYVSKPYRYTDIREATELLDFHNQAVKNIGYEQAEKMDDVIRKVLNAQTTGLTIRRANNAATWTALNSDTSTSACSMIDILASATQLQNNKARPAIGQDYVAVISPPVEFDLKKDKSATAPTWYDTSKYNNTEEILKGEIGRMFGVRFKSTTFPFKATGSATAGDEYTLATGTGGLASGKLVYTSFILGAQAFGVPDLAKLGSFKPQIVIVDKPDSSNPSLAFKSITGKAYYTSVVLNSSFGIALKTKSSQNFEA